VCVCVCVCTDSTRACASDSMFSRSRLVVGSSSARIPQFRQKVSARARRMISDANTWKQEERRGEEMRGGEERGEEGREERGEKRRREEMRGEKRRREEMRGGEERRERREERPTGAE